MTDADGSASPEHFMAVALDEARRARGDTSPNPLVGCTIVEDGRILSTGYHPRAGAPHAEIEALRDLEEEEATGATMFVTLEPCCHRGRTAPCTEAIVDAGIDRVVVAMLDPDPRVDGQGVESLRRAGVDVEVGLLRERALALNRPYVTYMNEGRPWVTAKYAMSLDGKIATRSGQSAWITGEEARRRVHEMRDRSDAIMVGTGTLLSDDPRLTCRIDGGEDPLRVALDARLESDPDSNIFDTERARTLLAVAPETADREPFLARGVEVVEVPVDERGRFELPELLGELADREIVRLFVEGGGRLLGDLFDRSLVDRVEAFLAPRVLGGSDAPSPVEGRGVELVEEGVELDEPSVERVGRDLLVSGTVVDSPHDD
ncbi:MAG: bifunctional diaminohydroxyphosphoribosylaminopyrimidine deaminase/5-amino-6-(5-phosphoribosylamino)uracil reductase RibD [Bradymonadaceae bacterium]